jgi:hypothetical protein
MHHVLPEKVLHPKLPYHTFPYLVNIAGTHCYHYIAFVH